MCLSEKDVESIKEGSQTVYTEGIADSRITQGSTSDAGGHGGNDLMSKEDDGFLEQSLQQEVIAPITTCSCLCCTNFDVPHQPADLEKLKTLVMYGQQKSYSRSIQAS